MNRAGTLFLLISASLALAAGCATTPERASADAPTRVLFAPPAQDPAPQRVAARMRIAPAVRATPRMAAPATRVLDPLYSKQRPRLSNKRVTVDFHRADVRAFMRFVAREGNVNIIVDDRVRGDITVQMQRVQLDELLVFALESKDLGFEQRGNIIRVVPRKALVEQVQRQAALSWR